MYLSLYTPDTLSAVVLKLFFFYYVLRHTFTDFKENMDLKVIEFGETQNTFKRYTDIRPREIFTIEWRHRQLEKLATYKTDREGRHGLSRDERGIKRVGTSLYEVKKEALFHCCFFFLRFRRGLYYEARVLISLRAFVTKWPITVREKCVRRDTRHAKSMRSRYGQVRVIFYRGKQPPPHLPRRCGKGPNPSGTFGYMRFHPGVKRLLSD